MTPVLVTCIALVSAAVGFAGAATLSAAKVSRLRSRVFTLAAEVERRVMAELGEDLDRSRASIECCAVALGWERDLEDLERFVRRVPTPKNPGVLMPDGTTTHNYVAALIAWQETAGAGAVKAAQDAHREAQAASWSH